MKRFLVNTRYFLLLVVVTFFPHCKQKEKEDAGFTQNNWYANAIIYNLDVEVFKDSDGDGVGDFKGLEQSLGYLDSLGIDVIWLAPFQPSEQQDDGYDVTDFYGIDKRLGTKADFDSFMRAAKAKGLKVITDMVLNHTSIGHPWFKAARADTNSTYHDWYVWAKEKPRDWNKGMVFPGIQQETWSYDELTKKYYFHRFYDFQPDLNFERADVQKMAIDVLSYWVKQGVDGFRLDAVPFMIDKPKTGSKDPEHMFDLLTRITTALRKINPDVALLGEANVTAKENAAYFGENGNRLQLMFNFFANQHLFYSLAKNDPSDFIGALDDFRIKPSACQWVFFLRNHDEVDLERLGNKRKLVFEKFGKETNMQLYDRGIRRRLAPMLSDTALVKMSYSLLFSLPGSHMIRYGEEIGMGDDLTLNERLAVCTPMQWNNGLNAGFSTAQHTVRPVISGGDYAFKTVNVANQLKDKNSLLNFIKVLIALRKQHPEIGLGKWKVLKPDHKVMLMEYEFQNSRLLIAHNFTDSDQKIALDETYKNTMLNPIFGNTKTLKKGETELTLPRYGYQWYILTN
jgi:maltose alpha-D-glucosyltransferase/alpha-amylase